MFTNLMNRLYRGGWVLLLWLLLALVMLVEYQLNQTDAEVGRVSQRDIRAQERVTYESATRTEREREKAASAVIPLYTPPDRSQAIQQMSTLRDMRDYLDAIRNDEFADEATREAYMAALQPLQFDAETVDLILSLPEEDWIEVVNETQRIVDTQMRDEIREGQLATILSRLPNRVSTGLDEEQTQVVIRWAGGLIKPNSFIDSERTEQARLEAREAVAPIMVTYEPGQIVVREGEIVTSDHVEALEALGLQQPARPFGQMLATALFLLLVVLVVSLYIYRVHPAHYGNPRVMGMVITLVVVLTLGARFIMPEHVLLTYLYPTAAAAMLVGVLLGVDLALLVTVMLSIIIGYLTNSIELVTYTFIGGMVASLVLWRVENLGAFVWTGAVVGLANVGVVLTFGLLDGNREWVDLAARSGMALLNGAASASMALVGFYVLSNFLGITTFLQLMELARPTHPLFRELMLSAPGTYHHTIIVSNLAERAAEAVGADMLLVRVGAYYHDIGKMTMPHYFVENQADGVNLHDTLDDPYQSAEIIIGHVSEGLQLAKQYKLPRRVADFIAQHHGTTSVAWFYHKACETDGEENVEASRFRYPGPTPQTREAAILMLADTVEATARALKPAGEEEIEALVSKSIASKLGHGQLDDCDLNLRDMERIRQAFVGVLQGVYHPRIAYPDGKKPAELLEPSRVVPYSRESGQEERDEPTKQHPTPDRPAVGSTG
ncbi:MAG: HDIG domain-containing protein [Chloroflexota bacterium]|nr:HDIG domain-containing protein [Chloroflexota bacterium]